MYNDQTAKTYEGTKRLKAWPATRAEYNAYRGWNVPANENPEDNGYIVEYLGQAGKNPNHPDHDGYISWSPADVFEATYNEVPMTASVTGEPRPVGEFTDPDDAPDMSDKIDQMERVEGIPLDTNNGE